MSKTIRHAVVALALVASTAGATSNAGGVRRATDAMATLLAASFLAEHCGAYVRRFGGRTHYALIADGVIIQISEHDVTMTDFVKLTTLYAPQAMNVFRNNELRRHGVDPAKRQMMCFLARSMAGASYGPGRFLERK